MDDDGSKSPIRTSSNDDDNGRSGSDTQFFDSQSWSPDFHGSEVDIEDVNESSQSTVPINDTLVFEEALETQVVDLGCETQVMDFGYETQVVDFGGETQVLNDVNDVGHMETQLFDSFENEKVSDIDDCEVSDSTEVLSVGDDLERKGGGGLFGDTEKGSMEQPEAASNEQNNSGFHASPTEPVHQDSDKPKHGSVPMRFTSVRSASLRTSGLAARNTALKGSKSVPSSIQTLVHSPDKSDNHREGDLGEKIIIAHGSRNETTYRSGNLAARKLCYDSEKEEGLHYETGRVGGGEDMTKFAGLSYVGSQEPGDLSQANALDFVDRFLKESVVELDLEIDRGRSTGGKSRCLSGGKGAQKLAKKAFEKNIAEEIGIYDWDDSREDEGGGDILRKINKDLSGCKILGSKPPSNPKVDDMRVFNSDSKLLSRDLKVTNIPVRKSERNFSRNLINEMNAESGIDCHENLENEASKTIVPDMSDDIRFDTQMAAEAMEALFFADPNEACKDLKKDLNRKRACPNDEDFATIQSRKSRRVNDILNNTSSISSERRSRRLRKQSEIDDASIKSQKVKKIGCEDVEKMSCESTRKRSGRAPKRGRTALSGGFLLDKQQKQELVSGSGPIARRTRSSLIGSDCRDENVRRNSGRVAWASKMSTSKALKSNLNKEFEKVSVLTNSKEIDTLSFPKRRRSIRNLSRNAYPEVVENSNKRKRSCKETRSSVNRGSDEKSLPQDSDRNVSGYIENEKTTRPLDSPCATPLNCKIPASNVSPVCMGNEYLKQSHETSRAKNSVLREIRKLSANEPRPVISPLKDLRKRREITEVRVLYSNHLDEDVIKHQKKILARLGVSVASSMSDATHFVADQFVRTRNMLEAIACGKPVVTHLWLESCGQANCFIDEKHHILRDAKKEKEFGFSMPISLASASQRPLLQGLRVLITPNTKPGVETISNLVKAVQGQAVERIGRSALKDRTFPDDLLVLSCEEDYSICLPFIEQGATIYSSELLLNGIVAQKLEYDRYRLFVDHVKKTRSSIWLKKDGNKFLQVPKNN